MGCFNVSFFHFSCFFFLIYVCSPGIYLFPLFLCLTYYSERHGWFCKRFNYNVLALNVISDFYIVNKSSLWRANVLATKPLPTLKRMDEYIWWCNWKNMYFMSILCHKTKRGGYEQSFVTPSNMSAQSGALGDTLNTQSTYFVSVF